jgi:drug/metabolite transporter (DMT)-like permease
MKTSRINAMLLAVLAAAFYAVGTPLSKMLLVYVGPATLASLLYFGAGAGMGLIFLFRGGRGEGKNNLGRADLPYVVGMIALDVSASILLMHGIRLTAAANVSLLNNFEIAATALIAFFAFHEKISPEMWIALILITLSSAVLSFEGASSFGFSAGSLMVLGASLCWGLENNCTRKISSKNTCEIVVVKGALSGSGALIIALASGEGLPSPPAAAGALALGFVTYGLSIFAYIRAQSVIGAAKTSAFYALAPFIGAFLSFLFLREELSWPYFAGLAIMAAGTAAAVNDTLKYRHSHMHSHTVYHLRGGRIRGEVTEHCHEHCHIGSGSVHMHMHRGR